MKSYDCFNFRYFLRLFVGQPMILQTCLMVRSSAMFAMVSAADELRTKTDFNHGLDLSIPNANQKVASGADGSCYRKPDAKCKEQRCFRK